MLTPASVAKLLAAAREVGWADERLLMAASQQLQSHWRQYMPQVLCCVVDSLVDLSHVSNELYDVLMVDVLGDEAYLRGVADVEVQQLREAGKKLRKTQLALGGG